MAETPDPPQADRAGADRARVLAREALQSRSTLVSVARRVLRNRDDAEGVVDECLSLLLDPEVATGVRKLGPWLHRTVLHRAIDRARAWIRQQERLRAHPSAREPRSPADEVERAEKREAVWRHLLELPPRQREVLVLREMEGLSYAEVSERLEIDPATARVHAHAGRRELRRRLAEWSEYDRGDGKDEPRAL